MRLLRAPDWAVLAAVGLAASGQAMADVSVAPDHRATTQVLITNFMFEPATLRIRVGTTVTWVNRDDDAHTVFSDPALFRSGGLDTGMSFAFRFDRPGTYRVLCSLHPQMLETIEVSR